MFKNMHRQDNAQYDIFSCIYIYATMLYTVDIDELKKI